MLGLDSSAGVTLLTSLLMRFPELGSATLGPSLGELRLEFYLDSEIETARFEEFVRKFHLSWDLFFELVRVVPRCRRLVRVVGYPTEAIDHDGEVEIIRVVRDLDTLSLEELTMVTSLISERFLVSLVEGERLSVAQAQFQEQAVLRSLERVRSSPETHGGLTGFRENGQVAVYALGAADSSLSKAGEHAR